MRTIKQEFNGPKRDDLNHISFKQLKRNGMIVLYERSDGEYEIVKLLIKPARTFTIQGRTVETPEREHYPTGEEWNGRHTRSFQKALQIFNEFLTH